MNVKSTALPSVALADVIAVTSGAPSLSTIVPVALTVPVAIVKVSSNSSIVSVVVGTLTVADVAPAGTLTTTLVVV
ncbi:hypothetical protein D3C84_1108280 [compost metagenome]